MNRPDHRGRPRGRRIAEAGFTLVELISVIALIAILAGLGTPKMTMAVNRAKVVRAIMDIKAIQADLDAMEATNQPLPASLSEIGRGGVLDPWGRPYAYLMYPDVKKTGQKPKGARRDKLYKPINSEYDLYSLGADGQSDEKLDKKESLDDVVRALDGGYIGLASRF